MTEETKDDIAKHAAYFEQRLEDMPADACHVDYHPTNEAELRYATRLATYLWETHWKAGSPNWKPLPDLMGVLTQIDNMVANLKKPGK